MGTCYLSRPLYCVQLCPVVSELFLLSSEIQKSVHFQFYKGSHKVAEGLRALIPKTRKDSKTLV